MIKNMYDNSRTANQLAKELVWEYGERAYYWTELLGDEAVATMTQTEVDDLERFIDKHFWRVRAFLGEPNPREPKDFKLED